MPLTLTAELVAAVLPERERKNGGKDHPMLLEWKAIQQTLLDLSPVRNVLAHQHVTSAGTATIIVGQKEPAAIAEWMEIRIAQSEALRDKKPKVTVVKDVELPGHYNEVESALKRLWKYERALSDMLQK